MQDKRFFSYFLKPEMGYAGSSRVTSIGGLYLIKEDF